MVSGFGFNFGRRLEKAAPPHESAMGGLGERVYRGEDIEPEGWGREEVQGDPEDAQAGEEEEGGGGAGTVGGTG